MVDTPDAIENLTDDQLNEAIRIELTGFPDLTLESSYRCSKCGYPNEEHKPFTPATDANDAVRVLEQFDYYMHTMDKGRVAGIEHNVKVVRNLHSSEGFEGSDADADTFPRAACIAVLKAVRGCG